MRFPEIHLGRSLMLATALALAAWGCQGPDLFYRQDGALSSGVGGREVEGTGGMIEGTGGMAMGTGGARVGTGGMAMGTGGVRAGTGGMAMGTGGRVVGTGGVRMGTGGRVIGMDGGMGTGGMGAGTGGMMGTDGAVGNTPCAGICDPSITMQMATNQVSDMKTSAEICFETTASITHANCSNLTSRTMTVNGNATTHASGMTPDTCANFTLPAAKNGGYCFHFSAGLQSYAGFSVF